jgi:hypothetical protein
VAFSFKYGNETTGFFKGEEFLDQLSEYQKNCARGVRTIL